MQFYQFDDVSVDVRNLRVSKAGKPCALEPKSFKALVYLIENRDKVVSKEELIRAVSPNAFVTDNALTRTIAQIRKVLNDDPKQARYIETVPTVGYRFISDVTNVPANVIQTTTSQENHAGFNKAAVIFGSLLICAALLGGGIWARRKSSATPQAVPNLALKSVQFSTSSGLDLSPAFSPDGTLIAYASDRTGSLEIYVRARGEEGRELRLTNDGKQYLQPAFSPDGSSIVFCSMEGGIYRVPSLGGVVHKLAGFGTYPSWSPDGSTIVFRSAVITSVAATDVYYPTESNLWTVPANGGQLRQITTLSNPAGVQQFPAWSQDGKEIRFINFYLGHFGLWAYEIATGKMRKLFDAVDGNVGGFRFTPDNKAMYYVRATFGGDIGIRKQTLDPETLKPIGEPIYVFRPSLGVPRDLAISPDGKHLAYSVILSTSGIGSVAVNPRDLHPAGEPKLLTTETQFRYSQPAFSPDGRTVAYVSWRKGGKPAIWLTRSDGSDSRLIVSEESSFPWFAPDKKSLFYVANERGFKSIKVFSLEDGASRLVAPVGVNAEFTAFSPDGTEVVFNSFTGAITQVWTMNLNTHQRKQISVGSAGVGFAHYSPNGKWMSVQALPVGGSRLARMPVPGGEPETLPTPPGIQFSGGWTSDNDKILFAGLQQGVWNVYWISCKTHQVQQLTNYHSARSYVRYPVMSPASDQAIFEFNESRGNVFTADIP